MELRYFWSTRGFFFQSNSSIINDCFVYIWLMMNRAAPQKRKEKSSPHFPVDEGECTPYVSFNTSHLYVLVKALEMRNFIAVSNIVKRSPNRSYKIKVLSKGYLT